MVKYESKGDRRLRSKYESRFLRTLADGANNQKMLSKSLAGGCIIRREVIKFCKTIMRNCRMSS